jgi:hypothetical protein
MGDRFAMPPTLPPDVARGLLARAQGLAGERGSSIPDTIRAVAALQAQDAPAAALGVRARRAGSTLAEVEHARFEERAIARTWAMRGTLHLIPAEDVRWMVALLGPIGLKRSRKRIAELGVGLPEAVAAARAALADGPRTRREVADAVRASGVKLADDPQVPSWLIGCAALEGHVIEAAPAGAFALTDDWLGPSSEPLPDRDAAVAELARRHAHAHPPAGPEDFASWSGLGIRDARRAYAQIAGELDEVEVLGRTAWVPRGLEPAPPHVRLLPAFDGILLGHRDRELIVRPEHARDVLPGGGILRPTLLVDGRVEGTWKLDRGTPRVSPFGAAPDLADEVADVERFRASA